MFSRSFKRVGLHYTAFRNAIREDSRQTAPSRGVSPRKKFAVEANVESRAKLVVPEGAKTEWKLSKSVDGKSIILTRTPLGILLIVR